MKKYWRLSALDDAVKVVTWNLNSIRSRLERLLDYLKREQPDVVALQELKCIDGQFPYDAIESMGYKAAVHGQKTYNGVAVLTKVGMNCRVESIELMPGDAEARFIHCCVDKNSSGSVIDVVCIYAPNGRNINDPAYRYKLRWFEALNTYIQQQISKKSKKIIVLGDFNIAPQDIDCFDPEGFYEQLHVSTPERTVFTKLLQQGLIDLYREVSPAETSYSWWDYRNLGFAKNHGLRIDFILSSLNLSRGLVDCYIARDERRAPKGRPKPSDHAPVVAIFKENVFA